MRINAKKIFTISLLTLFGVQFFSVAFEPFLANAASDASDVVVTLAVDSGIAITTPDPVTMAPNIGMSSNGSIGSATWNVRTNKATGYTLGVKASASPALVSGTNSFADYTPTVSDTPEPWSVAQYDKEFGFSAYGDDTSTTTWGVSKSCGTAGVPASTQNYLGFKTSDFTVATRATVTFTTGVDTTVCFAAEQNTIYAPSGIYTATITATATEI